MDPSEPLSVFELTRQIKDALSIEFAGVAVRGEISGATRPSSGHLYLTLKDDRAQLSVVMWRTKASRLRFEPAIGTEVVAIGGIDVYPPRGSYQLICDQLLPVGLGPLELAFRQMHERLAAEGLFEADRKRPLPEIPRRIAIVTSPTGAAVRDMLQVLARRWPLLDVTIVPVPVQGQTAAPKIAAGLAAADRLGVDVILCGRGGGSLDDLWAFNEEPVARAIAACRTPVVSAVGHEIDVTIADLVADVRALTPSEGAERSVPDRADVLGGLDGAAERMTRLLTGRLQVAAQSVDEIARSRAFARPTERVDAARERLDDRGQRLHRAIARGLDDAQSRLAAIAGQFEALSPLAVLARGYSLTSRDDGSIVRAASDVLPGDEITTRLAEGTITSVVRGTTP